MTGIRERRFWPPGMAVSEKSIVSAEKAIALSGIEKKHFGALIHGSVCRDFLEPATACGVHHGLGLPRECAVYDLSNACLGLLNGAVQIANMIELGQIRAGVVVGTESGRALVENTIHQLNGDTSLSRNDIKLSVASLTIGSGSAAIVLCHKDLSRTGNRLLGGVMRANTDGCKLCHSGRDESADPGMKPLMWTDSETLMREGIALGKEAFSLFLEEMQWKRGGYPQDVLPSGRQGPSKAAVRHAGARSAHRLHARSNFSATPARSPCPPRRPSASKRATSSPAKTWR